MVEHLFLEKENNIRNASSTKFLESKKELNTASSDLANALKASSKSKFLDVTFYVAVLGIFLLTLVPNRNKRFY